MNSTQNLFSFFGFKKVLLKNLSVLFHIFQLGKDKINTEQKAYHHFEGDKYYELICTLIIIEVIALE